MALTADRSQLPLLVEYLYRQISQLVTDIGRYPKAVGYKPDFYTLEVLPPRNTEEADELALTFALSLPENREFFVRDLSIEWSDMSQKYTLVLPAKKENPE